MIRIENIHKKRCHLDLNIQDLEIPKNQFTLVVGPNGHGKSTLLKLIAGTLQSEHMKRSGYDTKDVAWMMDGYPFPLGTVADSVELFKLIHEDFDVDAFYEIYDQFKLPAFTKHKSEGEKKLLYFSLLVALKRPILVLDEPELHLDSLSKDTMIHILETLMEKQEQTIICASNTITCFEMMSDYLIAIYDGHCVCADAITELIDAYPLWQGNKKDCPREGVLAVIHYNFHSEALIVRALNPKPEAVSISKWLSLYTNGRGSGYENSKPDFKK